MIGDITAKNAIRCYEEFLSRKDKFSFSIPLISYSTNNRYLKNEIQKDSSFIANLFVLFCTGEEYNHQSSYL
jgi:hypothetical protein